MFEKRKKGIAKKIALSLGLAMLLPTIANAQSLQTRPTSDYIEVEDRDGLVTGTIKRIGNTSLGIMAIGEEEISSFDFRGGTATSRVNCPDDPNYIYPNESSAKSKYNNCFDNGTYNQIERDLSHLMENQKAKFAFYNYAHPVNIRDESQPSGYELRYIHANVMMKRSQNVGEARRLGVTLSMSGNISNIYMKYENSKSIDVLGEGVVMPGAGSLKVYSMDGTDPASADLTLLETIDGRASDFDANTSGGGFGTSGVENIIREAGQYMDKYSADIVVIDYGNPITVETEKESANSNVMVPKSLKVTVDDRFYYKNECTVDGTYYGQKTTLETEVDYRRDRYFVDSREQAEPPIDISSITSFIDIKASDAKTPVDMLSQTYNKVYEYGYDTGYSRFTNNLADPIGENSSAPNNLFSIGSDDPYNGIPWSGFQEGGVATLRDETMKDIDYYVMVEKEPGYYETRTRSYEEVNGYDENGDPIYVTITEEYQVWIPPVYEQEKRNACIHNSQVPEFCDIFDCDGSEEQMEGEQEEGYYWDVGSWGQCSVACGSGVQKRAVVCMSSEGSQVSPSNCSASDKPITEKGCEGGRECGFTWKSGDWSECSAVCNGGLKTRNVFCQSPNGNRVSDAYCDPSEKPATQDECNTQQCGYRYDTSSWSSCNSNSQCSASGFSIGWLDGYWTEVTGKTTIGFNGTNMRCRKVEACSGQNTKGTEITVYGVQSRTVDCIRTDDNKKVQIGFCGQNQPYTHRQCVRSERDTCREDSGGDSDGTGGGR